MALFRKREGLFESGRVLWLPVNALKPNPDQPRRQFSQDSLEELAESIKVHGILQPLSVRRRDGAFVLVSGERRLRAAKLAGLLEVPCIVVEVDDTASSLLALVENLQRRDLDFWDCRRFCSSFWSDRTGTSPLRQAWGNIRRGLRTHCRRCR